MKSKPNCEGYRRYGGAFSLGPVRWEQCKEIAEFTIKVEQDGKVKDFPCCKTCWREAVDMKLKIEKVELIP